MTTRILALASVLFLAGCAHRCGDSCIQHANAGAVETRTVSYAEEVPVYTARTEDCGQVSTVAMRTGDCGHVSHVSKRTGDCGHVSHVGTGDCGDRVYTSRYADRGGNISTVAYTETLETDEPIETLSNPDRRIEVTEVEDRSADRSLSSSAERDRQLDRDRDASERDANRDRDSERDRESAGDRDSDLDRNFVKEAALANLTEIELGREALKNAASDDVRRFGQRMIDDHTKAQTDLKAAAGSSFELPTELDAEHRGMVEKHSRLSGREFDRAYMEMMVEDHSKVISKFERAGESAKDNDIREFAKRTIPVLREHLSLARDAKSRLASDSLPKN